MENALPKIQDYSLIRKIGEGSFGIVYLAKDNKGQECALKLVKKADEAQKNRERTALELYIRTNSKNRKGIIEILDCGRTEDGLLYYVMPLAECTLQELVEEKLRQKTWFTLEQMRCIFASLFDALDFLESENLIHRDIKPTNIIFINGKAVLSDIGLLEIEDDGASRYGTDNYRANAYFKGNADFWSVACVIFFILTGKNPEHWGRIKNWASPLGEEKMSKEELLEYARLRGIIFNHATAHRAMDLFRSAKEFRQAVLPERKSVKNKYALVTTLIFGTLAAVGALSLHFYKNIEPQKADAPSASIEITSAPITKKILQKETPEEFKARLKSNVIREENGDVRLDIGRYDYAANPLQYIDYKRTGANEPILPFLLYLDPNMDDKAFIEGLSKSVKYSWIPGIISHLKGLGFKNARVYKEYNWASMSDNDIQASIESGVPLFGEIRIAENIFYVLRERYEKRIAIKNIDDWIKILEKSILPEEDMEYDKNIYACSFIVGYNKQSGEILLRSDNLKNTSGYLWVKGDELRDFQRSGTLSIFTLD